MSSNEDDGRDDRPIASPALDSEDDELVGTARRNNTTTATSRTIETADEDPDAFPLFEGEIGQEDSNAESQSVPIKHGPTTNEQGVETEKDDSSSIDATASIPDDTPSVQGSVLSSPSGSRTPSAASPLRQGSPSSPHRPFDRRFHSRITSGPIPTARAHSPAFLGSHSRQSSLGSLALPPASEADESTAPWEVIKWVRFKKLASQVFSETAKRNFGSPTCLAVADQIVIGTSRGMILVFDHQQNHKAIVAAGTKAVESGPVTALAISADHTTVAAGHATGHIFTWEISKPSRPFLHIPPVDGSQPQARRGDGHIAGSSVVHVGFLGYRRTALVSADDRGMAFSHLATRGMGSVGRTIKTTRILGRYPEVISRANKPLKKSSVLAFSPLPLGNVEQKIDGLGLVAMLTPYLLVIVSTTPIAQTQHKAARPREVAAHSAMTAALAWFPAIRVKGSDSVVSKPKLAYAWSNVLAILEASEVESDEEEDKDKPPELEFATRNRMKAGEAIVSIQWLNKSVLAVLTITQQLLIIEDATMTVTDAFDLLPKNIFHTDLFSQQLQAVIESLDEEDTSMHGVVADAFHMSFRAYKGRLFLLGYSDVWWGTLTNWADRLLALMNIGDFIAAIRLASRYYAGYGERLTIGLPEDASTRRNLVGEKLYEMITASLRYAFGKNQQAGNETIETPQLTELAVACVAACLITEDSDFLFDEVFGWYNDHGLANMFMDVVEPHILDGTITSMPPVALKSMMEHFAATHTPAKLEEIICLLDTSTMDIDQVTSLCKQYNLYDAYIYVWNNSIADFTTPLDDLLQIAQISTTMNGHLKGDVQRLDNSQKIFPYISYILTGRTYPTGLPMHDALRDTAKSQIYDYFFSASHRSPPASGKNRNRLASEPPYGKLRAILNFDTPSFMSSLNEAFEDSFLNPDDDDSVLNEQTITAQRTSHNRQFIVRILLDVMATGFEPDQSIYLDMFVARNLAKYPQYMLLPGSTLQQVFSRLCSYPEPSMKDDAQLSVEYLLSAHHPSNLTSLIPPLLEARFFRVLKQVYRQEEQYTNVVRMYFHDEHAKDEIFDTVKEFLGFSSVVPEKEKQEIRGLLQEHIMDLLQIDVLASATTVDDIAPELHSAFLDAVSDDHETEYEYLRALLGPDDESPRTEKSRPPAMLEMYLRLMCELYPDHVGDYVERIGEGDLRLSEVIPTMERTGAVDAAIILEARSGHIQDSMKRLTLHLSSLQTAIEGLLTNFLTVPDDAQDSGAVEDLMLSVEKYVKVGIWLCQGQSKLSQRLPSASPSLKRANSLKQPLSHEEKLWLDLIESTVAIARTISQKGSNLEDLLSSSRSTLQQVFTALLVATSSSQPRSQRTNDLTFLRILQAFLSNAARSSPSLAELRNVLKSIFAAYVHEESLLALSNQMLDKDVFVHLDEVKALRQRGWRPRGQVCEVCRRRVWGPGIGDRVWGEWHKKENEKVARQEQRFAREDEDEELRGKGKAAVEVSSSGDSFQAQEDDTADSKQPELDPVLVFSCRHLYHQKCLSEKQTQGDQGVAGSKSATGVQLACPLCAASR